jgi:hypothetical protein
MATTVRTEKRVRSTFGQLVKWAFIAFNVLMLIWLVGGMGAVSKMPTHSDAERAGHAIGAALGFSAILGIWMMGDIILGLFVLLTRGNTVIVEETGAVRDAGLSRLSEEGGIDAGDMIARYMQRQQSEIATSGQRAPSTPSGFGRRR